MRHISYSAHSCNLKTVGVRQWRGNGAQMNRFDHTSAVDRRRKLTLSMKVLVTLVALSSLALAQSTGGDAAVCPLSESQTQKSIDAFAKIVPTLTQEPRCVNCHGGV